MDTQGATQFIRGQVPMSEMLNYQNDLTSMTQGRGAFTMEYDHYDYVPPQQMDKIVAIQLQRVERLLADRRMSIVLDASATHWLAERGYDPVYGARPLKRIIQRELQNPLAQQILEGRIPDGSTVHVSAGDRGLVIGEVVTAEAA